MVFNGKLITGENIMYHKTEGERILFRRGLIAIQAERNARFAMLVNLEFHFTREAVSAERVRLAGENVFVVFQRTDNREQNRRPFGPVSRVSVPHVFNPVLFIQKALELCSCFAYCDVYVFIAYFYHAG